MTQTIREAKNEAKAELLRKRNVFSVGVGRKIKGEDKTQESAIVCRVSRKIEQSDLATADIVPKRVNGWRTDVIAREMPKALAERKLPPSIVKTTLRDRRQRWRPVPGGVSIGHPNLTAGTAGCWVKFTLDGQPNTIGLLSNHHVLVGEQGELGDLIVQPGASDIGGAVNTDRHGFGQLAKFTEIHYEGKENSSSCTIANAYTRFGNSVSRFLGSMARIPAPYRIQPVETNLIDAAIVLPFDGADEDESYIEPKLLGMGYVHYGIRSVTMGDIGSGIRKSGRTTGLTYGHIEEIDVTTRVDYGGGRIAIMDDQIAANGMAEDGDSGSLGVMGQQANQQAFGLLFAGSPDTTIFCRIDHVMEILKISEIMGEPK